MIRIGFEAPYNYPFIVERPIAVAQIFKFLPQGLSFGLELPDINVTMQSLQPYDSRDTVGFIRTLAYAYVPTDLVNKLKLDLHTPNSKLYNNPTPVVWKLMDLIDPSIPLLASEVLEDGTVNGGDDSWLGGNNDNNDNNGGDGGSFLDDANGGGHSPITVKSAGIGVGVVVGAAAYGAAMFFVARRYKKRRLRHGRASSISRSASPGSNPAGALMSGPIGPVMMSGAIPESQKRGSNGSGAIGGRTSARGQTISEPFQAENSLGWN